MPKACELFLSDHRENGDTTCTDPDHAAALRRRNGGSAPWSPIVHGRDAGGARDFLDGQPINCGGTLELQVIDMEDDDYGSFSLYTSEGRPVRYEVDGKGVVLYADVGGFLFTKRLEAGMRFRWPSRGGRS
jgi:hypothetical protein